MNLTLLLAFLVPALQAIQSVLDPTTPAAKLLAFALQLLQMFSGDSATAPQAHHVAAVHALTAELPPESEWTPEGLLDWAKKRPAHIN